MKFTRRTFMKGTAAASVAGLFPVLGAASPQRLGGSYLIFNELPLEPFGNRLPEVKGLAVVPSKTDYVLSFVDWIDGNPVGKVEFSECSETMKDYKVMWEGNECKLLTHNARVTYQFDRPLIKEPLVVDKKTGLSLTAVEGAEWELRSWGN